MFKSGHAIAVAAVLAAAGGAQAAMITFTHEGFGGGTIGDVSFGLTAPVRFVITAVGDTDNRDLSITDLIWIDHDSASIAIDGVGTFNFITATRTFVNQDNSVVGFSRAGAFGLDLFNGPQDPAFSTWDMLTSIGPISGDGGLLQWDFGDVHTDGGILFFNGAPSDVTFTAVVIPSPGGAIALVALAGLSSRRRR